MLFIKSDKVRQIHSAIITLSGPRGRPPLPNRYIKFLWPETCLLFTLRLVSYVPTAGATSAKPVSAVACFLLRVFYGTPHPSSILPREKGSFSHSLMACQAAALCICCRGPRVDKSRSRSRAVGLRHHCAVQNNPGARRKRRLQTPASGFACPWIFCSP